MKARKRLIAQLVGEARRLIDEYYEPFERRQAELEARAEEIARRRRERPQ